MAKQHPIAWLNQPGFIGETFNPIRAILPAELTADGKARRGWHCEKVATGCANCYSEAMNLSGRFIGTKQRYVPKSLEVVAPFRDVKTVEKPLRWRKPRAIFWGDMTDLFGDWVTDAWLDECFGVMLASENFDRGPHRNIVLTKRPKRMREYLSQPASALVERWARAVDSLGWHSSPDEFFWEWCESFTSALWSDDRTMVSGTGGNGWSHPENVFPLRHLWTGISASVQEDLDRGIEDRDELCPMADLILCPSRLRWLSLEPLLGPIDLRILPCRACNHPGNVLQWPCPYCKGRRFESPDWIVVGCESGPRRRPCKLELVRSIVRQCRDVGLPVFVKQLDLGGQVSHDPAEWPEDLRIREFPQTAKEHG